MSFLKQNSGAKIYISTLPYTQEFQICHIEGESEDQVPIFIVLKGLGGREEFLLDDTNLGPYSQRILRLKVAPNRQI